MPFFPDQLAGYGPRRMVRARRPSRKAKLTRQLALRKPEVKDVVLVRSIAQVNNGSVNASGLFQAIQQGTLGSNRVGDQIRVLSIEVLGRVYGLQALDMTFSLVRPNQAQRTPLLTDWSSAIGGQYDLSRGWVLHHSFRDSQTNNVIYEPKKITFPQGMLVKYDPPTESEPDALPNKNEVYACHVNNTGTNAITISYSIRIRFVDA